MVLAGAGIVVLGRLGGAATARARARTAADAAALAGAAEGRPAAVALAEANGAELVSYEEAGLDTVVRVRLGPAVAVGRARRTGDRDDGSARSQTGADPALRAVLARVEQLLGRPLPIASARGLAVDVAPDVVPRLLDVAPRAGLCRPSPADDPGHFEVCR